MSAVAVRLGPAEFGLPLARVSAVLRPPPVTRTPSPPPDVVGVVHLRGALLGVLDLGTRLGGAPARRPGRLVVVSPRGGEAVALLVDRVAGIVETDDEVDPPPPEALAALPEGWLDGVVRAEDGRLVTLLDLDNVLAGVDR